MKRDSAFQRALIGLHLPQLFVPKLYRILFRDSMRIEVVATSPDEAVQIAHVAFPTKPQFSVEAVRST